MALYRIPKGNIHPDSYLGLSAFAFEIFDHIFFTDRETASQFGSEVVEIESEEDKKRR